MKKLPCHDKIAYEIQRSIQTFGPLTEQSLMKRCSQVAEESGCNFDVEYFNFICAEMQKHRFIRRSKSGRMISLGGELQKTGILQDAFWVLMEFAKDISFDEILDGPAPALITFFRNGNIYHLITVIGDGAAEIHAAKDLENDTASMRNGNSETSVLEKFIFVAPYSFRKDIAKQELRGEILVAHVAYERDFVPKLFFERM